VENHIVVHPLKFLKEGKPGSLQQCKKMGQIRLWGKTATHESNSYSKPSNDENREKIGKNLVLLLQN
jgi:hypothetical protein